MYEIDIKVIRLNNTNMPKTPTDFSKALIYSIVCKTDETLLYIGSTTNFKIRKYNHKNACNNEKDGNHNLPVYVMMRANGGWDSFKMTPVKEYPCESKIQLVIEEERIRKEMKANLNTIRAHVTSTERMERKHENSKQYREANVAKLCEKQKIYYEANAAKIAERSKVYYEANAAKIVEVSKKYQKANTAKIAEYGKKYREKNKELIAEQEKQYYEKNKDRILERNRIKRQELKNAL